MNTRITLWVVVGALFIIALFFTFKAGAVGSVEAAGNAVKTVASSSAGMVGGC